jgi:catechol 2,3-dioxygenase-like lactoylglutathione lyase family enzyme
MVGTTMAEPTIGVKDLERAKQFYGGVLGLPEESEDLFEIVYRSGNGRLAVYETPHAGTNKATYLTWEVDNIDKEVDDLRGKGVEFERYDEMEGVVRKGDVHMMGEEKAAWFRDPDGNILCLHHQDTFA